MKAKRRLPVIEAFILTGLLVDFISHASYTLVRVAPIHLAQVTLEQKAVVITRRELHSRPNRDILPY